MTDEEAIAIAIEINRRLDSGETLTFKILDNGHPEGDNFVYKIKLIDDKRTD